eukprot:1120713-Prymnesium_polylepis.1
MERQERRRGRAELLTAAWLHGSRVACGMAAGLGAGEVRSGRARAEHTARGAARWCPRSSGT